MTGHPSSRIADIGDHICASLKENTAMSIQRNTADADSGITEDRQVARLSVTNTPFGVALTVDEGRRKDVIIAFPTGDGRFDVADVADALRTLADAIHPPSEPADREPA